MPVDGVPSATDHIVRSGLCYSFLLFSLVFIAVVLVVAISVVLGMTWTAWQTTLGHDTCVCAKAMERKELESTATVLVPTVSLQLSNVPPKELVLVALMDLSDGGLWVVCVEGTKR